MKGHYQTLLLVIYWLATASGQVAQPSRPLGFVYNRESPVARVHMDVYLDLLCPDSSSAWPVVKQVAHFYGPELLRLTIFLFPLPYHQNSFYTSRATFVVHRLTNGTKTFDWMDKILQDELMELSDPNFHTMSDVQLLDKLAGIASELSIDATKLTELTNRRTHNEYEQMARQMWKYSCTRGVAGTPTFFINGFNNPQVTESWTLDNWKTLIDPLLAPHVFDNVDALVLLTTNQSSGQWSKNDGNVDIISKKVMFLSFCMFLLLRDFQNLMLFFSIKTE